MNACGDDCKFFLGAGCSKGAKCPFRHNLAARSTHVICKHWLAGKCGRKACTYRHMKAEPKKASVPCFWENQKTGCLNPACTYRHVKPREDPVLAINILLNEDQNRDMPVKRKKIEMLPTLDSKRHSNGSRDKHIADLRQMLSRPPDFQQKFISQTRHDLRTYLEEKSPLVATTSLADVPPTPVVYINPRFLAADCGFARPQPQVAVVPSNRTVVMNSNELDTSSVSPTRETSPSQCRATLERKRPVASTIRSMLDPLPFSGTFHSILTNSRSDDSTMPGINVDNSARKRFRPASTSDHHHNDNEEDRMSSEHKHAGKRLKTSHETPEQETKLRAKLISKFRLRKHEIAEDFSNYATDILEQMLRRHHRAVAEVLSSDGGSSVVEIAGTDGANVTENDGNRSDGSLVVNSPSRHGSEELDVDDTEELKPPTTSSNMSRNSVLPEGDLAETEYVPKFSGPNEEAISIASGEAAEYIPTPKIKTEVLQSGDCFDYDPTALSGPVFDEDVKNDEDPSKSSRISNPGSSTGSGLDERLVKSLGAELAAQFYAQGISFDDLAASIKKA